MSGLKNSIKKIPGALFFYNALIRLRAWFRSWLNVIKYLGQYRRFVALDKNKRFKTSWSLRTAITFEGTANTEFDRHYVYHTAWAARCLAQTKPAKHVDISSSLYFAGLCSAFVDIEFYDYRPADLRLSNLTCASADLNQLHFESNSIPSLSCMHTVEHIGLGRYGDPLDSEGDLKAMSELQRVLAKGGNLFFAVPIGEPRIEFNAHRIYSYAQIVSYFSELELKSFTLIGENFSQGGLIENPPEELLKQQRYGCGCFWFKKN